MVKLDCKYFDSERAKKTLNNNLSNRKATSRCIIRRRPSYEPAFHLIHCRMLNITTNTSKQATSKEIDQCMSSFEDPPARLRGFAVVERYYSEKPCLIQI